MEIKALRTEADYLAALREVSALIDLDPAADSADGERLDVLGTLVQAYEAKHYPIDPPDPRVRHQIQFFPVFDPWTLTKSST